MQNDRLNVMQIISNLDIGGAQEVVRTLAEYLTESGANVVVCTFKDGRVRQEIEQLGIPVEVLPRRRFSVVAFPLFVLDMLRLRRLLIDLVEKYKINVIQTHLLRVLDFLVLTVRWRRNIRIFWTIHNYNFALRADQLPRFTWLLGPKRLGYRLLYRVTARWVDGFIAVSDEVRTAIMQTIGAVQHKIAVICNGVDVKRYRQPVDGGRVRHALGLPEHACLIVVVGTLKEQKGHRYLIEAAPSIIATNPKVHLLFVGDGPLREALQAQVAAAGLEAHILFLGNRNDVPTLLAASDYFVLPSLWEGLPMALIEAMASGLPIVATEVSGTKQVMMHGETGLLIPPGDSTDLRDALMYLLSQPDRARAMGRAAQRHVAAAFGARKQADEHLALYRRSWNSALVRDGGEASVSVEERSYRIT